MTKITAIELENFQAIEQRTRIELKPITLMYGPNSAGKSSIFDALELLRIILDPTKFDQAKAADMVDRWARHPGKDGWRETSLAIEFPFRNLSKFEPEDDIANIFRNPDNWPADEVPPDNPSFYLELNDDEIYLNKFKDKTVRIELTLKAIKNRTKNLFFVSEYSVAVGGSLVSKLEKGPENEDLKLANSKDDTMQRWLTLDNSLDFIDTSLMSRMLKLLEEVKSHRHFVKTETGYQIKIYVSSGSLTPRKIQASDTYLSHGYLISFSGELQNICVNVRDIFFYLGTMLWAPLRSSPGLVQSDRRAPKPEEVLSVVDLGLSGWWDKSNFSPSSPSYFLMSFAKPVDTHYQYLAEATHAELLLRTANHDFWGGEHAAKHIEKIKKQAEVLGYVNTHLQRSLFTEKLYQLSCASTLMVPIDLDEDDPWSYYALAQPAVVRLFLKDAQGQKVELNDVGSGIPFVLPVLCAICAQGFVAVQQPELHLHPALQSSLADVFIEELHREGCGQFLIETHSEHILLRLLRRIRNTEKGKILSDDLKLTNDQIAIYYFDPQVGGGTIVSRQLVTPLGDFYNDWPRGFFSERNDDLFDE